jgi:hypothetical protein
MSTQYDPYGHQYVPPRPPQYAPPPRNGLGTAALVLGIVGVALS